MRVCNPRCSARTPVANCGVDLIFDAPPFGRLWYLEVSHAIGHAHFYSR
jgi:hypothetical protein